MPRPILFVSSGFQDRNESFTVKSYAWAYGLGRLDEDMRVILKSSSLLTVLQWHRHMSLAACAYACFPFDRVALTENTSRAGISPLLSRATCVQRIATDASSNEV